MDWLALTAEEQEALPKEDQVKVIAAVLDVEYAKRSARLSELAAAIPRGAPMTGSQSVELACEQAAIGALKQLAKMYSPLLVMKWLPPAGLQEMQKDQVERLEAKMAAGDFDPPAKTVESELVEARVNAGYL